MDLQLYIQGSNTWKNKYLQTARESLQTLGNPDDHLYFSRTFVSSLAACEY